MARPRSFGSGAASPVWGLDDDGISGPLGLMGDGHRWTTNHAAGRVSSRDAKGTSPQEIRSENGPAPPKSILRKSGGYLNQWGGFGGEMFGENGAIRAISHDRRTNCFAQAASGASLLDGRRIPSDMRRRVLIRHSINAGLLAASLGLLSTWAISLFVGIRASATYSEMTNDRKSRVWIALSNGTLRVTDICWTMNPDESRGALSRWNDLAFAISSRQWQWPSSMGLSLPSYKFQDPQSTTVVTFRGTTQRFEMSTPFRRPRLITRNLSLPMWPSAVLAIPPSLLLYWRLKPRARPGHCRRCGYNLTGNTSGRCPECGTAIANAGGAPSSVQVSAR